MSKKRLSLILGITVIVTVGFFLAAYIISKQGNSGEAEQPKNPLADFFPFGKSSLPVDRLSQGNTPVTNNQNRNTPLIAEQNTKALRQLSAVAVAGMSPGMRSGKTTVLFVERATGNIYETVPEDMRKDRISNALIPNVKEVFMGDSGKNIVYRYLKEGGASIQTFIRTVPNPDKIKKETQNGTTTEQIIGSFLAENITDALVSSDTKTMFYFEKTPDFSDGVTIGSIFDFRKNTSVKVFQSPFSEWLPVSFVGKMVLLQTKASQNVPGYLYSLDTSNGELQKIVGDINGLTALPSPDQQKILYSKSTRGGVALRLYNRREGTTLDIQLATLPEKCVWDIDSVFAYCAAPDYIPTALYPDEWYRGSIRFSDSMWKIDSKTGKIDALFVPSAFGINAMDITVPALSPNGDYLFFINKTDSTLWGYGFNQ